MTTQEANRTAAIKQFFDRHFRPNGQLNDLSVIPSPLPVDKSDLYVLQALCMDAARKAMHAGQHLEMRRLEHLARQLARRAGQ